MKNGAKKDEALIGVKGAIERAKEYGLDLMLLYENLKRTPTERIENFVRWLEFVDEIRGAKQRKESKQC